jgi:hypothetical protein
MAVSKTGTVPLREYDECKALNKKLLQENTDLKIQISFLQKEVARLKEAKLYVNSTDRPVDHFMYFHRRSGILWVKNSKTC